MPVRVANIRKHLRTPGEIRIYVGRPAQDYPGSPLANPWKIERDRGETLVRYREWLREALKDTQSPQAQEILRMGQLVAAGADVVLLCWCAPAGCHADVICEAVDRVANRLRPV